MSCENVQELIPSLLDGRLLPGEEGNTLAHLGSCRTCNAEYRSLQSLRGVLRTMDKPAMPDQLRDKLRVIASHERQRRLRYGSITTLVRYWADRVWLGIDNIARPVALPFAGGILSAVLLVFGMFSVIMPQLGFQSNRTDDVPTMISYTDPQGEVSDWIAPHRHYYDELQQTPQLLPVTANVSSDSLAVLLLVDPEGKVADFMTGPGKVTREMQSVILYSRFTPATLFGHPTWGWKVVVFPCTNHCART